MRVKYVVCPTCLARKVRKYDTSNKRSYTEETAYEKCIKCRQLPETAEEQLLEAMFGPYKGGG